MLVALALCLISSAEDKPKSANKDKPLRANLIRMYDTKLNEHIYTYGDGEIGNWRNRKELINETIIGQVALTQEPGTTRLWRAKRKDGHHYFYLTKPKTLKDFDLENFVVYVWTKGDDDRVAIHGCVLPDYLDLQLDPDKQKVLDFVKDTKTGINVKRKLYLNMCYMYPPAEEKNEKTETSE